MNTVLDLIFPDSWDTATRINVAASIGISINTLVYIILGYWNRKRFFVSMDIARFSTTLYLLTILLFFANRAYDVADAGRTIATWRLQVASVLLLAVSFIAPIIAIKDPYQGSLPMRTPENHPGERDYDKDSIAKYKVAQVLQEMHRREGRQ